MAEMPRAKDLFADADSPKKASKQMDSYLGELNKSLGNPSTTPGEAPSNPVQALESALLTKGLSADAAASLNNARGHQVPKLFRNLRASDIRACPSARPIRCGR